MTVKGFAARAIITVLGLAACAVLRLVAGSWQSAGLLLMLIAGIGLLLNWASENWNA